MPRYLIKQPMIRNSEGSLVGRFIRAARGDGRRNRVDFRLSRSERSLGDGAIEGVIYPVFPPNRSAEQALARLTA